ncbi:MAG: hypothetical protein AAFU80_13335 [Pseudomonadota bacterium]
MRKSITAFTLASALAASATMGVAQQQTPVQPVDPGTAAAVGGISTTTAAGIGLGVLALGLALSGGGGSGGSSSTGSTGTTGTNGTSGTAQ